MRKAFSPGLRLKFHAARVERIIGARAMQNATDAAVKVRSTAASGSQVYESKRAVHEYLLFHYGNPADQMMYKDGPHAALQFTERCAQICTDHVANKGRALDIGCAVGGSSFELAKTFEEVVGIDFSQHFIDASNEMKDKGKMQYDILKQGNIFKSCETHLSDKIDRSRVTFQTGDACNLSSDLGKNKDLKVYVFLLRDLVIILDLQYYDNINILCFVFRNFRCYLGLKSAM